LTYKSNKTLVKYPQHQNQRPTFLIYSHPLHTVDMSLMFPHQPLGYLGSWAM